MTKEEALKEIERLRQYVEGNDEEVKSYFKELISGYTIKFNGNWVDFYKDDKCIMKYDPKSNKFWLSYSNIWSKLQSKFNLNYNQTKELTEDRVEELFNCKGVTTASNYYFSIIW